MQMLNGYEEGRDVLAQLRRLPPAIHLASILARNPGVDMHPRISSRHRQQANVVGFQLPAYRCSPHGCPSLSPHSPPGRTSTRACACASPSRKASRHHTRVPERRRPHHGTPHHKNSPTAFLRGRGSSGSGSSPPLSSEDIGASGNGPTRAVGAHFVLKRGAHCLKAPKNCLQAPFLKFLKTIPEKLFTSATH